MIIYNETYKVDLSIEEDWLGWMKTNQIPHMLHTNLFLDYRICRLLDLEESDGVTYTIQYTMDSYTHYEQYIRLHATVLWEHLNKRFSRQCVSFHTVMAVLD